MHIVPIAKFRGSWFDLINTGIKTFAPLAIGAMQNPGPGQVGHGCLQAQLFDSGDVAACIDSLSVQMRQIDAQVGIAEPQSILDAATAMLAALNNSAYFDQTSRNENLAYLNQAKQVLQTWIAGLPARLTGNTPVQPIVTVDSKGQPIMTQVPSSIGTGLVSSGEFISGVPNLLLVGGAGLVLMLLLLKR